MILLLLACAAPEPAAPASEPAAAAPTPAAPAPAPAPGEVRWRTLLPGLDLAEIRLLQASDIGDSTARVLRVDPASWVLTLEMASARDGESRTATDWLLSTGGVAAINPSMFGQDMLSSVGWMSSAGHVNSARWAAQRSLLAMDPVDPAAAPSHLYNLGCESREAAEAAYRSRVQSIRMLGCAGENVWAQQERRWSAALIGEDSQGRPLFIHVRSPYSMHDLVDQLRALPLDLRALHYGEGGPEATLAIQTPALRRQWMGSYETGFFESDDNTRAWPVPNVIVVQARASR